MPIFENPATQPPIQAAATQTDRYAATQWGGAGSDLEMPSGQLAYVRKPGVEQLISAGVIHSMDTLSGVVDVLLKKADGKPTREVDMEAVVANPEKIDEMIHIVDRVVCHTVLKPSVEMTPNDVTRRRDGVIYCDMIDLQDRFFIFQYVMGGVTDLERFRRESSAPVGNVEQRAEDGLPTF